MSTPRASAQRKQPASGSQSSKSQRSILGFFQKQPATPTLSNATSTEKPSSSARSTLSTEPSRKSSAVLPAHPSSDPAQLSSPIERAHGPSSGKNKENELVGIALSSPSRKARKTINYAESDDEHENVFQDVDNDVQKRKSSKRRRLVVDDDSDDEFGLDEATLQAMAAEDNMDDFIVPDDSEDDALLSRKRKRRQSSKPSLKMATQSSQPELVSADDDDESKDLVMIGTSTAQQWAYDPHNLEPSKTRSAPQTSRKDTTKSKAKPSSSEPEKRHIWLTNILDADRRPPNHPDYDPRSLYIPSNAWNGFSPFEKQYWEIKQKFWDSIVFFKKGKFYELYENDAILGHQLFDLKLTDRVNMCMVGVPEASLDQWASQFVAKGYRVARVDQMESALAKEMRERDDKKPAKKKEDKVIRRELAAVLTSGTLVDTGMLTDDMSTFCMAIKEIDRDGLPAFGVALVDTSTAHFQLCEFNDDIDMTKFETLIAQMRPRELLVEKSGISAKALRILKNNTSPSTLWNYLKPDKEFWSADTTIREIEVSDYFGSGVEKDIDGWPPVLREAREHSLTLSAFGALLQYLRLLKIERELISLRNFAWYDPICKASSLVLDGQSLINLEVFANNCDGSVEGTLFSVLNRCITPFGKRLLRRWICHPLADAARINARLDAVDALKSNACVTETFTASLGKMPDLERLISRIHAKHCKAQEFVKVLEGFEQIEYTVSLLSQFSEGNGVIEQLISSMPNLSNILEDWNTAFDRGIAKSKGVLVPAPGIEEDFDRSQAEISNCEADLDQLLMKVRRDLACPAICYNNIGKEIFQLEVPKKVKVPNTWDQMSATAKVTRYYSPELRRLVRALQEAQETHAQITRDVAARFYTRFDENYTSWLAAVQIIAQLDCLISLAKASTSLGEPSCRPVFSEGNRTVLDFTELRHPCMANNVDDFIPNDIKLGGDSPSINLLTGANAAGKSTILRMTCIAVIMAQVGCYLPCESAILTPIDRIMSRLGANDNIFASQSTFFVELSETQKILNEATPRSLVILDELGRGTSSYDGVAVAQAVLHDISTRVGCVGFFATHYRSLAKEFESHPEILNKRMRIQVDDDSRSITFLYKLEDGVADGSFGMHCAAMCGIPSKVVENAEVAAREWEHTSRLGERMEVKREGGGVYVPLGMQSDISWLLRGGSDATCGRTLDAIRVALEAL